MHSLAEWILRGRTQAILIAVVAISLPLVFPAVTAGVVRIFLDLSATALVALGAAAVGLVTLRKGVTDGVILMMWALVPALLWLAKGDASPLLVLLGTTLLASVLRQTVSWPKTLAVAVMLGVLISTTLGLLFPQAVEEIQNVSRRLMEELAKEDSSGTLGGLKAEWLSDMMLGGLVAGHLVSIFISLMLARWWQALLYNPGGFQKELHQLRLPPLFAGVTIAVLIVGNGLSDDIFRWLPVFILPFMLAGTALVHGSVAKRDLGRPWLIAFYLAIAVLGPYLVSLLILLAVSDSFIDFRKRIPAKS
jgi:hypothetical protein